MDINHLHYNHCRLHAAADVKTISISKTKSNKTKALFKSSSTLSSQEMDRVYSTTPEASIG